MIVSDVLDEKVHQIQMSSWRTIKQGLGKKGNNENKVEEDKGRDSD